MVKIKEISYEDERLGFFADQRRVVQKRYDRLEKQIKPDEPYLSEHRQLLDDCGRELSFYNDVIEMLENGVVPKSEIERLQVEKDNLIKNYAECMKDYAREIFEKIDKITLKYLDDKEYSTGEMVYDLDKLKEKYITE